MVIKIKLKLKQTKSKAMTVNQRRDQAKTLLEMEVSISANEVVHLEYIINPNSTHLKGLNTMAKPEKGKTLSAQTVILNTTCSLRVTVASCRKCGCQF